MVEKGDFQAGLNVLTKAVQEFPHVPILAKSLQRAKTYCFEQKV